MIQLNSLIFKDNRGRVDKALQIFGSKIFHSLETKNPITQMILLP